MSVKECGNHGKSRKKLVRRIIWSIIVFIFIFLITVLLIWAILQPTKPRFIIQDATVYAFNVSQPNFLTSNFQVTIQTRNPMDKVGIYYDRLDIYATYRNQQITFKTGIPTTYQGHKETNIWSPFVSGTEVPIAPYNSMSLANDHSNGVLMLEIRGNGQVRFKVGTFISGKYHLYVRCPAIINFGNQDQSPASFMGGSGIKYSLAQACSVST